MALELAKGNETVLLVDDETLVRKTGMNILRKLGYRVLEATSGEEALRIYQEMGEQIDLVLLDIVMPGMDGGDLFDRLRAMDPQVSALVLSGFGSDDKISELMQRGCCGFIEKPYNMDDLSRRIREILDQPKGLGLA